MKKATAKSLAKTAVLDASDKPEDQDEARKRRVKMDFASWRKQTKAGKTTHQEEVGISSAVEIKKAQAEAKKKAIEDRAVAKQKAALGDKDVKEAKVDTGKTADEKATARNQRNNPKKGDKGFRKFATSAFIRRKEGQSLAWGKDSAASELRRKAHAARRGVKEETIDEKFATQYKDKGKLSKTDAPGSRHDHTHDVDPRMADHVPTKKVRKSSKAETRANVLKFDMKKEETIHELNRYEKETGKSSGPAGSYRGGVNTPRKGTPTKKGGSSDKIIHFAKGLVRGAEGRPTGQTRKSYDARGKEQDRKEKPAQTVTKRREARKRAIAFQQDTSGT